MIKGITLLGVALLLSACVDSDNKESAMADEQSANEVTQPVDATPDPAVAGSRSARLSALDNQIRTMVGIANADSLEQCRLAEVGRRACGGPEYYIAYSTKVTDEAALQQLIDEYTQLRIEHIHDTQEMSTCEVIPRPQLTIHNGVCRAVSTEVM